MNASQPEAPRFPFVAVNVPAARADDLGAQLFELGASGVEVRDDATLQKGPGGDVVRLVASFADEASARAACADFAAARPDLAPEVGEIVGDEWRDKYKEHFKPFALTDTLVVAPPWETYAPEPGETVLVMDPGRAFGTGLHATTSMVCGLLETRRERIAGARTLDVGTGSGILGLAALAFGADTVVAIDNDPEVIEVAAENAARNGFDRAMHVSAIDLAHVDGLFQLVVANIRSEVLITMAPLLAERAAPASLLILSGVLASEQDPVVRAFSAEFDHLETKTHEEGADAWVAIAMSRQ